MKLEFQSNLLAEDLRMLKCIHKKTAIVATDYVMFQVHKDNVTMHFTCLDYQAQIICPNVKILRTEEETHFVVLNPESVSSIVIRYEELVAFTKICKPGTIWIEQNQENKNIQLTDHVNSITTWGLESSEFPLLSIPDFQKDKSQKVFPLKAAMFCRYPFIIKYGDSSDDFVEPGIAIRYDESKNFSVTAIHNRHSGFHFGTKDEKRDKDNCFFIPMKIATALSIILKKPGVANREFVIYQNDNHNLLIIGRISFFWITDFTLPSLISVMPNEEAPIKMIVNVKPILQTMVGVQKAAMSSKIDFLYDNNELRLILEEIETGITTTVPIKTTVIGATQFTIRFSFSELLYFLSAVSKYQNIISFSIYGPNKAMIFENPIDEIRGIIMPVESNKDSKWTFTKQETITQNA